jgi:hypothetical protein
MAFLHGVVSTLEIDPAGGTSYTDISQYLENIDDDVNVHFIDVTTLGRTAKVGIPGLEDGKFKLKGFWDTPIDSTLSSCKRVVCSFRYRPAGAGTGLPQYTGKAIMSSYTIDSIVKDALSIKAEFTISEGSTRSVQA